MTIAKPLLDVIHSGDSKRIKRERDTLLARFKAGEPVEEAMDALSRAMDSASTDEAVRVARAIEFMARHVRADGALEAVERACASPDRELKYWAWAALGSIVTRADPEIYASRILRLLEGAPPELTLSALQSAAKRGFDIGPALPGVVSLIKNGSPDDKAGALALLPKAGAAGCDLQPILEDLKRLVGNKKRVNDWLAEGLAWAALGPGKWDDLDALLAHPSPQTQRAARTVAGQLLERQLAHAREAGDKKAMKEVLRVRSRLRA